MTLALLLAACGGGSSSSNPVSVGYPAGPVSLSDTNVASVVVESGPGNNVNIPYVSVTVCQPGTNTCKTIDHVLLDTGSTGLRLFSSVLATSPALSLPAHTIGAVSTISECAQFMNTVAWGTIRRADVVIAGHTAANVPIQVMESNYPSVLDPSCKGGTGSTMPLLIPPGAPTSPLTKALSANGILGVGLWINDGQNYFSCTTSIGCQILPNAAQQVQNPVALFSQDNNGVIVQLSAVGAAGALSAKGYLILGIGTQSNNSLTGAHVVPVNGIGYFSTTYGNRSLPVSFFDSGSNALFFDDASLVGTCADPNLGFYCPATSQPLSATIPLVSGTFTVNFSIANADTLFQKSAFAFNNLGGSLDARTFDWGLPFFFGRSVYTAIEGRNAGGRIGPFFAFTN